MLRVEHIYKSYGKTKVLEDVSLNVNQGDIIAILGPSGTGKTTLLRCINFLNSADSGTVTIDDLTVDSRHPKKKSIIELRRKTAMVFQHYNLFSHKTALENVMEGLIIVKKIPKAQAEERARQELNKVGLSDRANSYPSALSGGQQQRVAIARALALDPEVILFDEPTSALDPEMVGEVLSVIRNVAKEGITMLIVTHEISFAQNIATRIVFMDGGKIIEDADPKEFFLHPKEERSKQFLKKFQDEFVYTI